MVSSADNHVEIPGWSSMRSGVAFAGNANALAVARARLYANLERFGLFDGAFAVAGGAGGNVLAGAMAARTGDVELHASAGLRDLAGAAALRASARQFDVSLAVASCADVAPSNVQPHDAAANRRPEGNVDLILEIRPRLRPFTAARAAPVRRTCRRKCL